MSENFGGIFFTHTVKVYKPCTENIILYARTLFIILRWQIGLQANGYVRAYKMIYAVLDRWLIQLLIKWNGIYR